ncbi:helix-turn-helix domain-containing protein [Cohnella hashimotonis]|uniref:Helix-turn-helix domain-containing protein n=1 Tax=Cohnella hashimotonis TaxID=2826895 RepID=A0ABT6TPW9_9BACL|nr:helix-turn-helix domain-containing protein [Cohnella hashimotonis]MDI4648355.1 helix-turn-helix domain-containing protein [Cohnella hashimotonis]
MKKLMPRRTHIRIFLGSCLLFVLVSVPVVFFMTRQFSIFALNQIDKVNKTEITHSRDNAAFILDKMIAYGFTMYADKSVQAWMTADAETQDHEIEAIAAAAKYRTTEPFLKNAYLLNMRTEHVIDIAYGITSFADFDDQDILRLAKTPAKAYQRFFVHRTSGTRSLALMIPTVPSGQPSYGYLVLLLDDALMKQYLLKENKGAGFISFMLDEEGRLMLGPDEEGAASGAAEASGSSEGLYKELASRASGASGSFKQRFEKESWSVQYARIEPQGWTLYQMAKLEGINADFYAFRTKLMIVLAGLVALLLGILFWNSRRTYKPFSQLASQLETKLGPSLQRRQDEGPLAEHSVIRYGIEMLESRMVELDSSMREHRDVIKSEYLRQWILQGKLIPPVEQYLREHSELFAYGNLYIGVIRIDGYSAFQEKYEFASRKLMKYAMGNIEEEILRRNGGAEAVDLGSDHVVLLLSGDGVQAARLTGLLEEAKSQIDRWTQIRVTVAVSEARAFGDDIRAAYQHILELTMLKFVSGEDKIYLERDFENYMRSVQPLPDDQLLDELIKSVRMGKADEAAAGLDRLFAHMQTMHYAQSKIQLSLMLYTLFKTFNKLPSVSSIEGIESILESFDTLTGVRAWLERELLVIVEELSSKKGASRRDEIVRDIVDYVRNHLHDPMLTIEEISEHVSLSSRHVRQLFKESLDVTLSEYILQERIAKVKELLATTDWTVTDIGERAGFQTKSHFFTIFKKATGLTPTQYRDTLGG